MTIKVGDKLPAGTLSEFIEVETAGCTVGPNTFKVEDLTRGKKVAIFGLPGAFTPTCSAKHVPSYLAEHRQVEGEGRGRCDLHVGQRRVRDGRVGRATRRPRGKVRMMGDGSAEYTKALGLEFDLDGERPRDALPALFDAGRQRRREGPQHRGAGKVRSLGRRRRC